ncbi:MAG: hypothetical protein GXP33_08150 [Spirochaetes bacterium]|nr:hypothetical protein [Spirochaetota bacterium]
MEFQADRTFSGYRKGLVSLLLFLTAAAVFSQGNPVGLKVYPQGPAVDQEFKVEIYLYGNFFSDVVVLPPDRLGVFTITGGPYVRPDVSRNGIIITFTLKSRRKGKHLLRSFTVKSGQAVIKTKPEWITITGIKPKVMWRIPKRNVYIGETIPVSLEFSVWNTLEIPGSVKVRTPAHSWFEEFNSGSKIKADKTNGTQHFIVPLKNYLITPIRTGFLKLLPARVLLNNNKSLYSNSVTLRVVPLPRAVKKSGAVGDFNMKYSLNTEQITSGDRLTVKITLSGRGNLNYLNLPVPVIDGKVLKNPVKEENFSAAADGYNGYISRTYEIRKKNPGSYKCIIPDFYYIDSKSGRVKKIKSHILKFTVVKEKQSAAASVKIREQKWVLRDINSAAGMAGMADVKIYKIPWVYLLFLPGPVFLLFFMIIRRIADRNTGWKIPFVLVLSVLLLNGAVHKNGNTEAGNGSISRGINFYNNSDYTKALDEFLSVDPEHVSSTALFFDIAACYNQLDDYVKAIHYLRKVLKLNPSDYTARKYLKGLELKNALDNQITPSVFPDPNYLFILIIVIFNVFFLFLIVYLRKKDIRIVLLLIMLSVFLFICAGFFAYSVHYLHKKTGIIAAEKSELKKIPENIARPWIHLKNGTAVEVLETAGGYRLIRTGDGILGWVVSGTVMFDK